MNIKEYFTNIYKTKGFGGKESVSGPGSEGEFAKIKKEFFCKIVTEYPIGSVLDLGCGDLHWMQDALRILPFYIGVDIVQSLIENNTKKFGRKNVGFQCMNITKPGNRFHVDIILCLDVFLHLLDVEVKQLLANLRNSEWRYLLITTDRSAIETKEDTRWRREHWFLKYREFFDNMRYVRSQQLIDETYLELYERQ